MIKFFSICLLAISSLAYGAGVLMAPERLFKLTGAEVNSSEGDLLYKSQAAGYYTGGGGVVVRSPIKSVKFVNATFPKIPQAGCGGIDIYTGGFSFITGKQLVDTMQAISSNSAGFAFMLGIETVSPSISNQMRQLQSWANTINGIGINSCEKAAQLVGSVWPASDMASQHICRTMGTNGKQFTDYVDGRHKCSNKTTSQKSNTGKEQNPLHGEYNIAWESLMAHPYFKDTKNHELAEMYMTLVGTFVVKDEKVTFKFPMAENNEFLTNLLHGGTVKKYKCDEKTQCLIVTEVNEEISAKNSWFARIRDTLESMQKKVVTDEPLDDTEKGLLCTTRLPLFKIINALIAHHRGSSFSLEMDNITDIITWDLLAQVINQAIETIRQGCMHLRANSMYAGQCDQYLEDIERVRKIVHRYEEHAHKAIDLEMRLIQKIQLLEKQINSEIMVY
jgi:conjugative transfer pilus assembly protein TraH